MQYSVVLQPLMAMQVLFGAFWVSLLLLIIWICISAYLSPLKRIPTAHPSAPFTSFWMFWNRLQDREIRTVAEAFRKKGPIVRLGPNEIAVNVIDGGIKIVHNGGFHKSQWYDCFINYGIRNTFSSLGNDHAILRRRISHIYSKSYLHQSQHVHAIMSNVLQACMLSIHESVDNGIAIDFLSLSFAHGIDCITAMIFGLPQATSFIRDTQKRDDWLDLYLRGHPPGLMLLMQELPNLMNWLVGIGFPILSKSYQTAKEELESWVLDMVDQTETELREPRGEASLPCGHLPVLYHHLRTSLAKEDETRGIPRDQQNPSRRRLELASEVLDYIVATRDTFGISMAYVLWEICRHEGAEQRIREELRTSISEKMRPLSLGSGLTPFLPPSPETLDQLPYLNAVIRESLRLRNTAPTPNPRLTPMNETTKIGTYDGIPGGVRISGFAWCLHRQEDVFEHSEEWDPDRWLSSDKQKLAEMNKWDWTFGSGSRMCLGKNLAWQLIQSTLAMIYINFSAVVADDKNFGIDGAFVTGRKSDQLLIRFKHKCLEA